MAQDIARLQREASPHVAASLRGCIGRRQDGRAHEHLNADRGRLENQRVCDSDPRRSRVAVSDSCPSQLYERPVKNCKKTFDGSSSPLFVRNFTHAYPHTCVIYIQPPSERERPIWRKFGVALPHLAACTWCTRKPRPGFAGKVTFFASEASIRDIGSCMTGFRFMKE